MIHFPSGVHAFRVFISGLPQTFSELDDALTYIRAEALHNNITSLALETVNLSEADLKQEIAVQEEKL